MKLSKSLLLALLSGATLFAAQAQVKVDDAWARATVPGQKATGVFMKLTAPQAAQLVGASSPAAGVVEVHEMKMDKDVMKMSAIAALDLPAGKTVELKPGGYHVMLMDLKAPLAKDATVPVTLTIKDGKGVQSKIELKVPVRDMATAAPTHGAHKH